jgi:hypothetical protein
VTLLQKDFQEAIWFLENEILGVNNYLVVDANSNAIDKDYGVRVMNIISVDSQNHITQRQSQLIFVPEPGTLILLGSGILGLVAAGRKKFRV